MKPADRIHLLHCSTSPKCIDSGFIPAAAESTYPCSISPKFIDSIFNPLIWRSPRPSAPPLRSGRRRGVALARCTKHVAAPARSSPTQRVHPHRRREGCGARRTDDQIAGLTIANRPAGFFSQRDGECFDRRSTPQNPTTRRPVHRRSTTPAAYSPRFSLLPAFKHPSRQQTNQRLWPTSSVRTRWEEAHDLYRRNLQEKPSGDKKEGLRVLHLLK
nr:uncharacterized protein LOC127301998 isoform X2 [Lolium perenne]